MSLHFNLNNPYTSTGLSLFARNVVSTSHPLAFADIFKYVAEPSSMEVACAQMLDDAYLASRAKLINMKKAQDFGAGQFIWRAGEPKVEGYVVASDARRDG